VWLRSQGVEDEVDGKQNLCVECDVVDGFETGSVTLERQKVGFEAAYPAESGRFWPSRIWLVHIKVSGLCPDIVALSRWAMRAKR